MLRLKNSSLRIKGYIFITFLFLASLTEGQVVNYVNNPSFEQTNGNINPYDDAKYWVSIDSVNSACHYLVGMPPYGVAPYCPTGFQYPKSGNNFILVSFFCNNSHRWYPRNRLKQVLKPNTIYCAKYYVVNTNNNRVAIENYSIYFGDITLDTMYTYGDILDNLNPQIEYSGPIITDTLRWTPISGTLVATGTEKYMVLGNFKSNAMTNTMVLQTPTFATMCNDIYIDDVSLIEMDLPAFAGRDTIVHPGDSVFIGREPDIGIDEACIWYKWPDMTNPIDTIAGFWINPTSTATYVVRQQLWCTNTPKWDTVLVIADATVGFSQVSLSNVILSGVEGGVEDGLHVFPNPANDYLELKIKDLDLKTYFDKISIYNHLGQHIKEQVPIAIGVSAKLNTEDLKEGVYFLELSGKEQTVRKRFVVAR